jgi:hypothetical protein
MGIRQGPTRPREPTSGLHLNERPKRMFDNGRRLCDADKLACFCEKLVVD